MEACAVEASSRGTTVKSGSTRAEHRLQKLLHRVRRALPDDGEEKVDTASLLAIILGTVGLISLSFFAPLVILCIPAFIFGIAGLSHLKRDGTKGKGLAIAGIVTGALGILVMLVGLVTAILILAFFLK